jgi:hypothetical protein
MVGKAHAKSSKGFDSIGRLEHLYMLIIWGKRLLIVTASVTNDGISVDFRNFCWLGNALADS